MGDAPSLLPPRHYIIVDLEATCWEEPRDSSTKEIIEIGAVRLVSSAGSAEDSFSSFVRPVLEPRLSDFCTRLTSIRQEDVDEADTFPEVFPRLLAWIGQEPFTLCSWGAYDLNQFRLDCARHGLELPQRFERHINLKESFAQLRRMKPCGMAKALKVAGLTPEGTHHRAADDAWNIAKLALGILPQLAGKEGS